MTISSIGDPLLQALTDQTSGAGRTGTSAGAASAGSGLDTQEFAKLLEMQMNQSTMGLDAFSDGSDSSSSDSSMASLMSPLGGDNGSSQLESMMLLDLINMVDKLTQQQAAQAQSQAQSVAPASTTPAPNEAVPSTPAAAETAQAGLGH